MQPVTAAVVEELASGGASREGELQGLRGMMEAFEGMLAVGRCRLTVSKPRVESAYGVCNQRLKLQCDEPLSNVAFNFELRRYMAARTAAASGWALYRRILVAGAGHFSPQPEPFLVTQTLKSPSVFRVKRCLR